jgi:hypothetical protein
MAAQVDRDDPEIFGERDLAVEEAAMRHQPVHQHDRRAAAAVAIGDMRPVRSGENVQDPSPNAAGAPVRGSAESGALLPQVKTESIFKLKVGSVFQNCGGVTTRLTEHFCRPLVADGSSITTPWSRTDGALFMEVA